MHNNYSLLLMIVISFFAGYLATMNVWAVNIKHVRWHLNDIFMVSLMVGWMVFVTYLFMRDIVTYKYVLITSILVIIVVIYAIRKQSLVNDKQFMNGMIPHHSMAILMAKRIKEKTKDPRVKQLADDIIRSQNDEINIMTNILNETNSNSYIF